MGIATVEGQLRLWVDGQVARSKGFRDFAPPPRWDHDDVALPPAPVGSESHEGMGPGGPGAWVDLKQAHKIWNG